MSASVLSAPRAHPRTPDKPGPFIETHDGVRLFWTEWGEGPPVLFLHSWAMETRMWDYQFAALAEAGFRCLGYDRRGHGRSDLPANGYDFDTFADDLSAVIDALDLCDLTLVGHSMGCNEIARYLARHGDARVARVAFLAPVTPCLLQRPDNPAGLPAEAFAAMRAAWARDFQGWIAENTDGFFVPETSPALKRWGAEMLARTPLTVALACNEALTAEDFRADVAAIRVPTLILHGDADVSAPLALTGEATAALIDGATLQVYAGAPHGLMYTHMQQLNEDLARFLRSAS